MDKEWESIGYLKLAEAYANAQSEADRLDGMRKRIFSLMVIEFTGEGKSNAAAEHLARASDQYGEILEKHSDAATAANLARAVYDSKKVAFEFWRTKESTKRAEMNLR